MAEPCDAIPDPVQSAHYWTGYYEGKRVAGNEATEWIRHRDTVAPCPRPRPALLHVLSTTLAVAAGFYVMMPYQLGDASNLAHFAVGILYGTYLGNELWYWRHR